MTVKVKELKYSEKDITFFANDVEKIQQKPAMYIGDTSKSGFLKVILEPLDNAVDEFRAGRNTFIHLDVDSKSGIITVNDGGVGIPVGIHPKAKISTLVHIFTALQSSGKINSNAYKNSAGTHGIGVTATNAMSEFLECYTYRKDSGGWHYVKFENGHAKKQPEKIKQAINKAKSGTIVRFKHNLKYFNTSKISKSSLTEWCEITSYLNAGLEIKFTYDGKSQTWKSKQGLIDYVEKQLEAQEQTNICKNIFSYSSDTDKDGSIEFALAFTNLDGINIQCHTNSVLNVDKGVHYEVFRTAFHKVLKNYAPKAKFTADDALDGLLGILNFNINDAQFNNQAKNKLVDIRVKEIATPLVELAITEFLTKNRKFAMDWAKRAGELRKKTEQFLDAKGLVKNIKAAKLTLSAKLAKVSGKCKPEDCELYLVEGDSAGGTAKRARNRDTQAVFPLKGKPLNVMEADIEKIQKNVETATLLAAIGIDPTKLGEPQAIEKLPYGKIIYLADADVDGPLHGNTKVLTLDGKNPSIKSLVKQWNKTKKPFWVYSRNQKNELVPALAYEPKEARVVTKMVTIKFDSGKPVKCDESHKWKLKNPSKKDKRIIWKGKHGYVAAKDLVEGDTLDSMYYKHTSADGNSIKNKAYQCLIGEDKGSNILTHHWVKKCLEPKEFAKYRKVNKGVLGGVIHIHHENHKPLNNVPTNLVFLGKGDHFGEHGFDMAQDFNGSKKHLKSLEKFYASESGKEFKRKTGARISEFNKTEKNSLSTVALNKEEDVKALQMLGKISILKSLLVSNNYLVNSLNWDKFSFTKTKLPCAIPLWENLPENHTEAKSNLDVSEYKLIERKGYVNNNQKWGNFCSLCDQTIDLFKKLNAENYEKARQEALSRGCKFYPKWQTMENYSNNLISSYKSYRKNHRIISVTIKECKPTSVYCMVVPDTGNFMISDENGGGVCSSNSHINTLLSANFYKFAYSLFEKGMIYIVKAPEYLAFYKNETYFAASRKEMLEVLRKAGSNNPESVNITHLKGWGEISDKNLKKVAFNVDTRELIRIKPLKNKRAKETFEGVMKAGVIRKKLFGVS